jgi:oxygen-independent coproporphyrinogen III oxidase
VRAAHTTGTEALAAQAHTTRPTPLGLYIHIPFCERKCPYCDFNTYAGLDDQFGATVEALCCELAHWAPQVNGRSVTSIFIGGGTPTVLAAPQLTRLLESVHTHYALDPACEITCEANPGTVDRAKFQTLRDLGVNRLSLGVQSFQPDELTFLGRIHDVADVYRAVAAARDAGLANINLDFIFGLPNQPVAAWRNTLEQALGLAPEHLSLYSLIVEPNTPLHHWVKSGSVPDTDDDQAGELYEEAMATLAQAGYVQYEVSNWAKPGLTQPAPTANPAFACAHNLVYWRNQEYLGIGPGAHSHMRWADDQGRPGSRRWSNRKPVPGYTKRMVAGESVVDFSEEPAGRVSMGETMMLGLRLVREGVTDAHFEALHGEHLRTVYAAELERLSGWGMLDLLPDRVRLTPRGLMVGNQVFAAFLGD